MDTLPSNMPALRGLSAQDASLFHRFGFGQRQTPSFHCVHHAFEHHVSKHPKAIAVEHLEDTITYQELNDKANALASRLRAMGVCPGARVCLLVQRSISMVIGIMATLKAGAAYVPLDGGIVTQSTLEFVLKDSQASVVLALPEFVHRVSGVPVINLEEALSIRHEVQDGLEDLSSPDDSVYIIYTSGMLSSSSVDHRS